MIGGVVQERLGRAFLQANPPDGKRVDDAGVSLKVPAALKFPEDVVEDMAEKQAVTPVVAIGRQRVCLANFKANYC